MLGRKGRFLILLCSMAMILGMGGISFGAVYTSDLYVYPGIGGNTEIGLTTAPAAETPQFVMALNGYTPLDALIGARVYINITDEDPNENVDNELSVVLMTSSQVQAVAITGISSGWYNIPEFVGAFDLWAQIENDGNTFFILRATGGDFLFNSAQLEGTTAGTTAVPEPGTMMLLGSGLLGLVAWGRKKGRK